MQPKTLFFEPSGGFPNSRLPALIYPGWFADQADRASAFERLFEANGWAGSWRNGLFRVHHYHSTAHEVLGVYQGSVTVCLGGEQGTRVTLSAGDVAVLPAGLAHKNDGQSSDFRVVGAYPQGTSPDMKFGEPNEQPRADHNIAKLAIPLADPVLGEGGALTKLWRV
jgi:uncharacterized protein YjlB